MNEIYKEGWDHKRVYEELNQTLNEMHLKHMIEDLSKDKSLQINVKERLPDLTPAKLNDLLVSKGWIDDEDPDENGWQQDTWIYYAHNDYTFGLVMEYSGYFWTMKLYRSDIDD